MITDLSARPRVALLFAAVVAASQACSSGEAAAGPDPIPAIALIITPVSATVVRGGSVAIEATLVGSGGFAGDGAAFSLTGAPGGVTIAVSNLQRSGSVTFATITTTVAATVPPGTYSMHLTGSGAGVSTVSTAFELTVPVPAIALDISPGAVTVAQGESVVIAATLTGSGGFAGAGAAVELLGAPAGITFAVSGIETDGPLTTARVTASVATSVPVGTYALYLIGSGADVAPVAAALTMTVVEYCFTISVSPGTLSVLPEDAASATTTIQRSHDWAGNVTFSGKSAGGGIWAVFDPPSTTGNSTTLIVGPTGPRGTYSLAITGSAPGCVSQTFAIVVTVP